MWNCMHSKTLQSTGYCLESWGTNSYQTTERNLSINFLKISWTDGEATGQEKIFAFSIFLNMSIAGYFFFNWHNGLHSQCWRYVHWGCSKVSISDTDIDDVQNCFNRRYSWVERAKLLIVTNFVFLNCLTFKFLKFAILLSIPQNVNSSIFLPFENLKDLESVIETTSNSIGKTRLQYLMVNGFQADTWIQKFCTHWIQLLFYTFSFIICFLLSPISMIILSDSVLLKNELE